MPIPQNWVIYFREAITTLGIASFHFVPYG